MRFPATLLSLPDEALDHIVSYSRPRKESQVFEWIGALSVCRRLASISRRYPQTSFNLDDYSFYESCIKPYSFQTRDLILEALVGSEWIRASLREFHVDWAAVLEGPHY